MSTYVDNLNWRYATKRFDESKKISKKDLDTLKEAVRLSASSYGMQPYEIFVIESPEIKEELRTAAYNQPQLTEASHVVVFAAKADVTAEDVTEYMENVGETRGIPTEQLEGFSNMINGAIVSRAKEEKAIWAEKQCYIALGNLLSAAANMKIDACPMEGFDATGFDKILGLEEKGLHAAVIATIGYRSTEDQTQEYVKVRKSTEKLFTTL
ncbi:Nitroreductase [Pustulibacterium marinum]|uniref:Nitroreductase n=1 Tax=Pustulibacterium marinum TaxID=1224947 RepID=A0A1I7HQK7_9FLAO|nr:NAD(P)H-dependent oxidoreductase [Pustulibacterium marinum]SFU62913.1 Nitroreductase [Pustulibacterium marinum]